jgi:hypothetical protein
MIVKQAAIELVQIYLAGGDAPADIRGTYHPQSIEAALGVVYDDLVSDNPAAAEAMAITEDITVSTTAAYNKTALAYPPIGPKGVFYISSGVQRFNIVPAAKFFVYQSMSPGIPVAKVEGEYISFSTTPVNSTASVLYIPNFSELDYDAPVILQGNETKWLDLVVQRMRVQSLPEKQNDSHRDMMQAKARR